ncbi:MAG: hypothetical protein D6813_06720 [Calditrichaeota bacterium]|nr:MAG: hypothetical protein D6813_06720 [Calditrichota bacterium]
MQRLQAFFCFTMTIILACGGPKATIAPMLKEVTYRVAVLPFNSSGFLSSQKPGTFASGELAKMLFIKKRAVIVDPAIVNATMVKLGLTATSVLPLKQLRNLAKILGVQLVIVGEVRKIDANLDAFFNQKETRIMITLRLLDPENGTVLGIVSHEIRGKDEDEHLIMSLIEKLVDALDGLKIRDGKAKI